VATMWSLRGDSWGLCSPRVFLEQGPGFYSFTLNMASSAVLPAGS
jgi:hypothetical protein